MKLPVSLEPSHQLLSAQLELLLAWIKNNQVIVHLSYEVMGAYRVVENLLKNEHSTQQNLQPSATIFNLISSHNYFLCGVSIKFKAY